MAMANFEAVSREQSGKGSARALRREGKIPAVLYRKGEETAHLGIPLKDITLAYQKGGFFNHLVEIKLDGKTIRALPKEIQVHPVTDMIEHADFLQVSKDSAIRVKVPVRFLNQERSAGIKRGGVLNVVRHDLELICHPDKIPGVIQIDILNANIGDSIHINDIHLPEGAAPAIRHRNFTIATIAGRSSKMDEEPTPAAAPEAGAAAAPAAEAGKDAGKKEPAKGKKE